MFRLLLIAVFCIATGLTSAAEGERNFVQVYDPYIEIHTGPGRGYPVFHVVNRDDWIEILVRQTDWFKIRTEANIEGWVSRAEIQQTLSPNGKPTDIHEVTLQDFMNRSWELGASTGDFSGANVITVFTGYHFTENLSAEISYSQVVGDFSSSQLWGIHVMHEPFPEWTFSPFFTLGTGIIETTPKTTLGIVQDTSDQFTNWGLGARMYLSKRFILRVDYKNYVVFSSRDQNEEIKEWKAGFGFFF